MNWVSDKDQNYRKANPKKKTRRNWTNCKRYVARGRKNEKILFGMVYLLRETLINYTNLILNI